MVLWVRTRSATNGVNALTPVLSLHPHKDGFLGLNVGLSAGVPLYTFFKVRSTGVCVLGIPWILGANTKTGVERFCQFAPNSWRGDCGAVPAMGFGVLENESGRSNTLFSMSRRFAGVMWGEVHQDLRTSLF